MTTNDKSVIIYLKKFLAQQEITELFMDYLKKLTLDVGKRVYRGGGIFRGGDISSTLADTFTLETPCEGMNSDGVDCFLEPSLASNIAFENNTGSSYYVGIKPILIPDETERNVKTSLIEYRVYKEIVGLKATPNGANDNGDGTITFIVDSVTEAGVSNAGRKVTIWMKRRQDGGSIGPQTESTPFETCDVTWDGSNNVITTSTALGQQIGLVSEDENEYECALLGPIVKKNTDLRLDDTVCFLGIIDGNTGAIPTVFDQTDRKFLPSLTMEPGSGLAAQLLTLLEGGGTINHDPSVTGKVAWGGDLKIRPLGASTEVTIAASNVELADDEVAYVQLPDPFVAGTLTMQKAPRSAASLTNMRNVWIFHRNDGVVNVRGGLQLEQGESRQLEDVVIGNSIYFSDDDKIRFVEADNEYHFDADGAQGTGKIRSKEIRTGSRPVYSKTSDGTEIPVDASLNEVFDRTLFRNICRPTISNPPDKIVNVSSSRVTLATGETYAMVVEDTASKYPGGTINFSTGVVTGGGDDFTPYTPTTPGTYFIYGVVLARSGKLKVITPSGENVNRVDAEEPVMADGVPLWMVTCKDDGTGTSGTIQDISEADITIMSPNPSAIFSKARTIQFFDVTNPLGQTVFQVTQFDWTDNASVRDINVRLNGVNQEQGVDFNKISSTEIEFDRTVRKDGRVEIELLRIEGAAAGSIATGPDMQTVYNNGRTIETVAGAPWQISGPAGEKIARFLGDIDVTGIIDPKGVGFTEQASNPLPAGMSGIWLKNTGEVIHQTGGGASIPISATAPREFLQTSGETIYKGWAVRKQLSKFHIASRDTELNSRVFGVLLKDVPNNEYGSIQTHGTVPEGILTASNFVEGTLPLDGSRIWLHDLGKYSITPPTTGSGLWIVYMGIWDEGRLVLQISPIGVA